MASMSWAGGRSTSGTLPTPDAMHCLLLSRTNAASGVPFGLSAGSVASKPMSTAGGCHDGGSANAGAGPMATRNRTAAMAVTGIRWVIRKVSRGLSAEVHVPDVAVEVHHGQRERQHRHDQHRL